MIFTVPALLCLGATLEIGGDSSDGAKLDFTTGVPATTLVEVTAIDGEMIVHGNISAGDVKIAGTGVTVLDMLRRLEAAEARLISIETSFSPPPPAPPPTPTSWKLAVLTNQQQLSTTIIDASSGQHSITNSAGNAAFADTSPYRPYLTVDNGGLSVAGHADFEMGTGDFEVKLDFKPTSSSQGNYANLFSIGANGGVATRIEAALSSGGVSIYTDTGNWRGTTYTYSVNVWTSMKLRRTAGNMYVYFCTLGTSAETCTFTSSSWQVSNAIDYTGYTGTPALPRVQITGQVANLVGQIKNFYLCSGTC